MSVTHRIAFAFEILLAELIFLFPCEKRQHFFLSVSAGHIGYCGGVLPFPFLYSHSPGNADAAA